MHTTYNEACRRAAHNQDLDAAIEVLSKVFENVTVEQTGGFCMCIQIPTPSTDHPGAFVWVTNDGTEEVPEYVVGFYTSPDEDSTYSYRTCPDLGAAAEVIQAFRQGAIQ